ncbi:endolytic transglycosylase MltG [Sphingomonas sp. LHG3406-1]|uniref:endolytic transglycosylase MltG n=1 Tax=Sphingomonas sp. LHG3406-1 TaxID=2804617 RepID=UPI0026063598|nr:endolytic transglycosylase MltG [Sphingomonas sp. LHG3406-1]
MKRLLVSAILLGVAALLVLTWLFWWSGASASAETQTVTVEEGATLTSLCPGLERKGLVRDCAPFRAYARLLGSSDGIQAGEFEIPAGTSQAALLDILQHGSPVQRLVTVPEGMPSILVAEKLAALPYLTGAVPDIAEGSVLPDSYSFARGEARSAVARRMEAAMAKALAEEWAKRKPGTCPVSTPEETIILASIVEKETAKPSERRAVAGVYCNRLKIGMKLDADPTVIYPVTKGKPLGRRILRSELNADTGYNTYRRAGLPAGPIANPGRASIAAVLDPEPHQYIYFVADGTGGHVFARTYPEHQANVEKWFAIRKARREM